jgi:hypothetical protein
VIPNPYDAWDPYHPRVDHAPPPSTSFDWAVLPEPEPRRPIGFAPAPRHRRAVSVDSETLEPDREPGLRKR